MASCQVFAGLLSSTASLLRSSRIRPSTSADSAFMQKPGFGFDLGASYANAFDTNQTVDATFARTTWEAGSFE
jgi:hypothetical protein